MELNFENPAFGSFNGLKLRFEHFILGAKAKLQSRSVLAPIQHILMERYILVKKLTNGLKQNFYSYKLTLKLHVNCRIYIGEEIFQYKRYILNLLQLQKKKRFYDEIRFYDRLFFKHTCVLQGRKVLRLRANN